MIQLPLGVDIGDLRLPGKDAIRVASEMALAVVEIPTVSGELAPEQLSSTGRRHLVRYVEGYGLRIAALRADLPEARFTDPAGAERRVERTREIIRLAVDMRVPIVTAGTGALTHPSTGEPSDVAVQALAQIADVADSMGVTYSLRPGEDSVEALAKVMDRLRCPSIGFAIDPGAMVMSGRDPISLLARFPDQVSLLHARDGTAGREGTGGSEARFGAGDVAWDLLFAALGAADFSGACILREPDSRNPVDALQRARDAIERYMRPMQRA